MSLSLYDEALQRKLKEVFPNVVGASTEEAFSASQEGGKVRLPLISFYRISNPVDNATYNMPEAFKGRLASRRGDLADREMTIPIIITYQIDIWGTSRKVVDEIFTEFLYFMLRKPNLEIKLPTSDTKFDFSMILQDSENSTELSDFESIGRIYRSTLTYEVSAKLFYLEKASTNLIREFDIDIN